MPSAGAPHRRWSSTATLPVPDPLFRLAPPRRLVWGVRGPSCVRAWARAGSSPRKSARPWCPRAQRRCTCRPPTRCTATSASSPSRTCWSVSPSRATPTSCCASCPTPRWAGPRGLLVLRALTPLPPRSRRRVFGGMERVVGKPTDEPGPHHLTRPNATHAPPRAGQGRDAGVGVQHARQQDGAGLRPGHPAAPGARAVPL